MVSYVTKRRAFKRDLGIKGQHSQNYLGGRFLASFQVPFPTRVLNKLAIVRFLDHADRRIRRYIRAKEKLIALLEEQRQAIIHQAVTGRIDVRTGQLYPAYKSSGVEWLGEVPAHWGRCRLRNVVSEVTTGSRGWRHLLIRYIHGV